MCVEGGGGGGGYSEISNKRRLGVFFFFLGGGGGVQKFEFLYFWGFQKNEYFLGYEDFVDIFWGVTTKLAYI